MIQSNQKKAWMVLLLGIAVALLYGQFLHNLIVFDDLPFFMVDNDGNQPVSAYHLELFQLRSLPYTTLAWTKAWFGLDLIWFRLGNLLLHWATVLALFFWLSRLFAVVEIPGDKDNLSPLMAAFFAALLFALHPVSTYAVGYLVQRTTVMATLFGLFTLLAYLHGSVQRQALWLWLTIPLYYLAVFAKEHVIMLPAVLMAVTVLLHGDWPAKLRQRWPLWMALALIALLAMWSKRSFVGSVYEDNAAAMLTMMETGHIDDRLAYPLSVMTQTWIFFKYAFLWLVPNPAWMSVDMREPFAQTLLSPYLGAVVLFLAWGGVGIWLLCRRGLTGLAGFALLSPWLMFMTEISTVRLQEMLVLYRSYLWAPFAFCMLPVALAKINGRMATFILSLAALAMMPMSMDRLMTLSHPVLLWDDAARLINGRSDLPGVYRIYYNRGTEYLKIDQPDKAIADLKRAIALSKEFSEANGNLGAAYFKKADWPNAVAFFSRAIQITHDSDAPINLKPILGRAQALENMGQLDKALADYRVSCQLARRGCEKLPAH